MLREARRNRGRRADYKETLWDLKSLGNLDSETRKTAFGGKK